MTRRSRCPPLRARGGHVFFSLLIALLAAAAVRLPAQDDPYRDYFLLGFGWGGVLPLTPGFATGAGVEDIESGPLLDDLVRAILIRRTVADRLVIDIDHDAERLAEGELFGGNNIYSLLWQGHEGEALRRVSIGNLHRAIPGSYFLPIDAGGSESFALTAEAQLGPVTLEGLARYGSAVEDRKRFRGSRLSIEADLADVAYARARFFLLPDADIDEAGLQVVKSSPTGPILIDGRRYALLAQGTDWKLDNAGARLTLSRSLASGDELAVTYTVRGTRVGDPSLGLQAIIDAIGARDSFNKNDWPEYFGLEGATDWLFLRRDGLNSYWELRNTFYLEDLEEGLVPEQVSVQVLRTPTFAPNPAYNDLADDFHVSLTDATISFEFIDDTGRFYPRPFPGEDPFGTLPVAPENNPFDPDNTIYGGPAYAPPEASVTTARVRYLLSTDTYRLAPGLIPDSIRVTVDGKQLPSSSWTIDPVAGTITFAPGVIGPQSDVEVVYRWMPIAGTGREFTAAVGAAFGDERLGGRNLLALTLPIPETPAPRLGEENPARLADSLDANVSFGAAPGESGFAATVTGSAALALTSADLSGVAIIADMEDDRRIGISLSESAWTLATPSTLLDDPPTSVPLNIRGDLLYENLWEDQLIGGSVLHEVSWDNSENPQFTYAQKAGPYNSADSPPGSTSDSLVLDVEFPAVSTGAWTAVSAVLSGIDAGSTQRLSVWFRGVDVVGKKLRVYAEALSRASEDLDNDAVRDGEASAADEGYAITPLTGGSTVLGTDRFGGSNGRLDSEDRNGNGVLDTGADTTDTCALLAPFEGSNYVGPDYFLASLPLGDSDWDEASLDITDLVSAKPGVFRNLRGIRITVVPEGTDSLVTSGKVLIGGFSFSGSPFSSSSANLSAHEVTPEEDPDLGEYPFEDAYPEVYRKLHGGESYREDHGIADKSLAFDVVSNIVSGTRALVELPISPPADLSAWKQLKLYVLVPTGNLPPADASFLVGLESGSDTLEAALPASAFREGWNEVVVLLESPWTVIVNGTSAGTLAGKAGVVQRVSSLRFGLEAGASDITAPLRFLTDEWHVAQARLALEAAARVEASAGWRGALLSAGDSPLVSDPFFSAGYEHRSGTFLGPYDRIEDRWHAGFETLLAGSLAVSFGAGQAYDRPAEQDPDVLKGLENGATDLRSLSLVLDTGHAWVPVIEHRWDRSRVVERDPVVSTTGPQVATAEIDRESLSLSERLEHDIGLMQWLSFSRTWTRDARDLLNAVDGALLDDAGSRGLLEAGQAGLSWTWEDGKVSFQAARDRVFDAPDDPDPADGAWSYFRRLGGLFAAAANALDGACERTLRDHITLDLQMPRTRHVGATLTWEAGYTELNVDTATGIRDVNTRDALTLSMPVSPDGEGRILLTPEASVTFTGTYRGTERPIGEAELLFAPWPGLLLVPLTWSRTLEHGAADPFMGDPDVKAASNAVAGRLSLAARIATTEWYLPSRASISLKDDTGRDDGARSQKRAITLSLGKNAVLPEGQGLTFDADGSYTRDFAAKVRSLVLSARTSVQLPGLGGGALSIDQSSSWTHERQAIGDPLLSLLPRVPDDPGIVVAPRPDQDTLRNALTLAYAWSREGTPYGADIRVQRTSHTERLVFESIAMWVEPGVVSSSVPIRLRFEHATEIDVTDTFTLGISGKAAAGVEKRTGAGEHLLLPAIGFEVGITGKMRF
ncbi:MAG: hypothetical protein A2177_06640 [Spirochaetes bacterium RBG_13_68_11]|nr:MAG: hypothetical protein A2177_06640 [Spirochaetes bacterium RBG_13_68_11]